MSSSGIKGRRSVKLDGTKKECTKGVHSFLFGIQLKVRCVVAAKGEKREL